MIYTARNSEKQQNEKKGANNRDSALILLEKLLSQRRRLGAVGGSRAAWGRRADVQVNWRTQTLGWWQPVKTKAREDIKAEAQPRRQPPAACVLAPDVHQASPPAR